MATKYNKGPKNIKTFRSNSYQIVPKLGFGFENKPSGNPARDKTGRCRCWFAIASVIFLPLKTVLFLNRGPIQ
jgi:hypothetical protein